MPAPDPIEPFAEAVIRSRIMDRETLMRLYTTAGDGATASAEQFAKYLQGRGSLTPFQVGKLRSGHWQGLVIGAYTLLCPIGRGGMGIVYLARRNAVVAGGSEPALVALKLLAAPKSDEPPALILMRDRFAAILAGALVTWSFFLGFCALVARGMTSGRSPASVRRKPDSESTSSAPGG